MAKTYFKEAAKFFSGAEAFHAVAHTYFWLSDTTITMFGITLSPTGSMGAAAANAIISLLLGIYGWKSRNTNKHIPLDTFKSI
jgi:hypothetical protein